MKYLILLVVIVVFAGYIYNTLEQTITHHKQQTAAIEDLLN